MDAHTIQPHNVTDVARHLLALKPSIFPQEAQSQWLSNIKMLEDILDYFLNAKTVASKEHIVYSFDQSLNALIKFTRYVANQLPKHYQYDTTQ